MVYITTALVALAIGFGSASAQTPAYTRQTLKLAMQTAHTAPEYNKLALYFADCAVRDREIAEEHERTLSHELANPTFGLKYPTAVDRARRLREYYLEQARKAHKQSEHYRLLASESSTTEASQ